MQVGEHPPAAAEQSIQATAAAIAQGFERGVGVGVRLGGGQGRVRVGPRPEPHGGLGYLGRAAENEK